MVSITFLFYFLPAVLLAYYIAPRSAKNIVLFIASLLFYASGSLVSALVLLFSAAFNYASGIIIAKTKHRKPLLAANLAVNIALMLCFNAFGIAFYTLRALSYTIDIYRKKTATQYNFISFGLYLALFPLSVAGPIVRYNDVARQLNNRRSTGTRFLDGVTRFCAGLCKKAIIADNVGALWNVISGYDFTGLSAATAWLGIICFALWIYFALSGYSDMAIGLGKMFGFEFGENFNYPYTSKSITEFMKRWHISLNSWFKEYVGGRTYLGIFIAWLLIGLWHGISLNFALWGLYFAIILAIEKAFLRKLLRRIGVIGNIYTVLIVIIGWVLFATGDLPHAINYLGAMFNFSYGGFTEPDFMYNLTSYAGIIILAMIIATGLPKKLCDRFIGRRYEFVRYIFAIAGFMLAVAFI